MHFKLCGVIYTIHKIRHAEYYYAVRLLGLSVSAMVITIVVDIDIAIVVVTQTCVH